MVLPCTCQIHRDLGCNHCGLCHSSYPRTPQHTRICTCRSGPANNTVSSRGLFTNIPYMACCSILTRLNGAFVVVKLTLVSKKPDWTATRISTHKVLRKGYITLDRCLVIVEVIYCAGSSIGTRVRCTVIDVGIADRARPAYRADTGEAVHSIL